MNPISDDAVFDSSDASNASDHAAVVNRSRAMEPNDDASVGDQGPVNREAIQQEQLGLRMVKSEDLLQGDREVLLMHRGQVYRLRETRNGKLILGK